MRRIISVLVNIILTYSYKTSYIDSIKLINTSGKSFSFTDTSITKNDNSQRKYNAQVVYPIISNGDTIGTVILLSKESNTKMNEVEKKVAQSAATFLGSQMEI